MDEIMQFDFSFLDQSSNNNAVGYPQEAIKHDYDVAYFTQSQQVSLSLMRIASSFLSLLGTSVVILNIQFRRSHQSNDIYHRLMLGVNIFIWINSLQMTSSSFAMPSGTPGVWLPIGNQATCDAQGVMGQFGKYFPFLFLVCRSKNLTHCLKASALPCTWQVLRFSIPFPFVIMPKKKWGVT